METVAEILGSLSLILDWAQANYERIIALALALAGAYQYWSLKRAKKDTGQLIATIEDASEAVMVRTLKKVNQHMREKNDRPSIHGVYQMTIKSIKDEVEAAQNPRIEKLVRKIAPPKEK